MAYICTKCVVGEHKGHRVSDQEQEQHQKIDPVVKKRSILGKKIETSIAETEIFEDDVMEIGEQL